MGYLDCLAARGTHSDGGLLNNLKNLYAQQDPTGLVRRPYPSELGYFKTNKDVSGMATIDGKIILNPFSNLSTKEQESVIKNERVRLWMRSNNITPDFKLTEKQRTFFLNTPYAENEDAMKQSIVARIISGDPSAMDATVEQNEWAKRIGNQVFGGQ